MPTYDSKFVIELLNLSDGYMFVTQEDADLLVGRVGTITKVPVVFFPRDNENGGSPTYWEFAGTPISATMNKRGTKGCILFTDGSTVFLNTGLYNNSTPSDS